MSEWQPIETAPKGSNDDVLVYDRSCGVCVAWFQWGAWIAGYDCYGNDRKLLAVTHWKPIPEPPNA